MEYRPGYQDRFSYVQDARRFCQDFFPWYKPEHYHSGLNLLTRVNVPFGHAARIISERQSVLDAAYLRYPERFVKRAPLHPSLPDTVWINPPAFNREFPP